MSAPEEIRRLFESLSEEERLAFATSVAELYFGEPERAASGLGAGPATFIGHGARVTTDEVPVIETATVVMVGDRVSVTHDAEDLHGALQLLLFGAQAITNQLADKKVQDGAQGGGIFGGDQPLQREPIP